ncbi:TPA: carbohydrate ABC transporter permease, partial [Candidatus Bipolaricaulota bacterium]|nr:carbohydrate ABC transporter permease [Candidatus Bipolaricaulota bacterium]
MRDDNPAVEVLVKPRKRVYVPVSRARRLRIRLLGSIPYLLLGVMSLPAILMYLWLILGSFSKKVLFGLIPTELSLHNWRFLVAPLKYGFGEYPSIWLVTWNTLFFAGGVTLLVVMTATLAGFALSRISFRGREELMQMIILLHAAPGITLLIAIFYVLHYLGLLNTLWGVILVKAALEIPWSTWIIKGFFDDIPWDVEWSAYVDGCNRFQAWYKVILPLIRPGIAAIAIFSFLAGWGEFIYLYTFIFTETHYTLSLYVLAVIGEFRFTDYGVLSAVAFWYMIPT